jgi:hypothetical protein
MVPDPESLGFFACAVLDIQDNRWRPFSCGLAG